MSCPASWLWHKFSIFLTELPLLACERKSASRGQVATPGYESPKANVGAGRQTWEGPALQLQGALSATQSSTGVKGSQTTSGVMLTIQYNTTSVNLNDANLK